MSETIIYVAIGILVVIVAFLALYYLLGGRLKRAKIGFSREGIYSEFELFEIQTDPVKVDSRSAPIEPKKPPQAQPAPPAQQPSPETSPIVARELVEGKPKFMSDEYIVDMAMHLRMDSEEGDRIRFIDHTARQPKE